MLKISIKLQWHERIQYHVEGRLYRNVRFLLQMFLDCMCARLRQNFILHVHMWMIHLVVLRQLHTYMNHVVA